MKNLMGSSNTYCCGLHPRGSVILIAIVDIILSLIFFLLSTLALADLHKVSAFIERDVSDLDSEDNELPARVGINEFTREHGQVVLILLGSLISLFLALGLFVGVRKDWDCPIKAWMVNGCVIVLLGVISLLVLTIVTNRLIYTLLFFLIVLRIYEIWVVFDFLRNTRFTAPLTTMSRSCSTERLHSV
ncbi:unnamed protein product [Orchesella dallaii]|uniref:Uncharacterized protein n=1 Tax=Orchesella dallaii TaxID=48710 RepID=A0ABP1Q8F0_9HEXA